MDNHTWNIDIAHSGVHFSVRHMVIAKVRGKFTTFRGQVETQGDDLTAAHVTAEIDASSIDTGVGDRDTHLRSADFLDTERFPKLTFESTGIDDEGDGHYRVAGKLTIRDVTREVTLDVEHGGVANDPWGNRRSAFTARTSLDRDAFGLKWNQALEAGGVLVGNRIDIEIEVEAVSAASQQVA